MDLVIYVSVIMVLPAVVADTIDYDFLRELEGFRTEGYVPNPEGSNSGVTIGAGIDLGSKDRKFFEDLDVPNDIINKLEPYFGLKKADAVAKLKEIPLTLADAEANRLSEKVTQEALTNLEKRYNNAIGDDKLKWNELTDAQRTVITSVLFQYGSPNAVEKFWLQCISQNWAGVIAELRDFKDDYPTRRNKEADYLKNDNGVNSFEIPQVDPCMCRVRGDPIITTCSMESGVLKGEETYTLAEYTGPANCTFMAMIETAIFDGSIIPIYLEFTIPYPGGNVYRINRDGQLFVNNIMVPDPTNYNDGTVSCEMEQYGRFLKCTESGCGTIFMFYGEDGMSETILVLPGDIKDDITGNCITLP